jgi:hypothetical protein
MYSWIFINILITTSKLIDYSFYGYPNGYKKRKHYIYKYHIICLHPFTPPKYKYPNLFYLSHCIFFLHLEKIRDIFFSNKINKIGICFSLLRHLQVITVFYFTYNYTYNYHHRKITSEHVTF